MNNQIAQLEQRLNAALQHRAMLNKVRSIVQAPELEKEYAVLTDMCKYLHQKRNQALKALVAETLFQHIIQECPECEDCRVAEPAEPQGVDISQEAQAYIGNILQSEANRLDKLIRVNIRVEDINENEEETPPPVKIETGQARKDRLVHNIRSLLQEEANCSGETTYYNLDLGTTVCGGALRPDTQRAEEHS